MTLQIEMLKRAGNEGGVTLRIEGQLAGSFINELEHTYISLTIEERGSLQMDLEWVNFVDETGHDLLKRMVEGGGMIIRSNLYIDSLFGRRWVSEGGERVYS